jgi:hypothetical protein
MYVILAHVGLLSLRVQGDTGVASQHLLLSSDPVLRYHGDSSKNLVTNSIVHRLSWGTDSRSASKETYSTLLYVVRKFIILLTADRDSEPVKPKANLIICVRSNLYLSS